MPSIKARVSKKKKPKLPPNVTKFRSAMSAIKAKCKECSGGNVKEVDMCPIEHCPLYSFRNTEAINLFYPNLLTKNK